MEEVKPQFIKVDNTIFLDWGEEEKVKVNQGIKERPSKDVNTKSNGKINIYNGNNFCL
jgi:hypothetical protein